ncbi:sugar ABC transporter substrate-binding protein [Mediterraneibacter massiliensis]|uniref:sugar ABC transporter substrate-binding protein n=1 Tax=Mediterraneibacter massiliensis TaxID=1720300 RepID=UPI0024ACFD63|nr:substrate-binding domain-containing protein [Mediterraneibacter massiliensis]
MKKRLLSILLTLGLIVSMTACSNDAPKNSQSNNDNASTAEVSAFDNYARPQIVSNEDVSIIYLISNLTDESNKRCEQQVAIEAAHRGWDYQVINYEKEDNFREYFQNAINQQPTAIIIGITQSFDSYQDLVAQARDAGIGIYSNDNSVIEGVISNSTMDNAQAARELMDQVVADYPDGISYAVFELAMSEVMTLRANEAKAYSDTNNKLTLLDSIDLASTGDLNTAGYTVAQTWLQQYSDELQFIFCSADTPALSAAEAITQAGDTTGEKTFLAGVDGGSSTWSYIRNKSPLKYTYSQPFEYFSHMTCEVINDIQVEGLNPGDEGCSISKVGEYITAPGIVTSVDNCPKPGDSIHSVFDFYGEDPDDKEAWYNWTDGPGIYEVTE